MRCVLIYYSSISSNIIKSAHFLSYEELFSIFINKEIPDKSFSILVAEHLGIKCPPGFIFQIYKGAIVKSFFISRESINLNFSNEKNIMVRYDFRDRYTDLKSWLLSRSERPGFFVCDGSAFEKEIQKAITKRIRFADKFLIIAQAIKHGELYGSAAADAEGNVYLEIASGDLCYVGDDKYTSHSGKSPNAAYIIDYQNNPHLVFQQCKVHIKPENFVKIADASRMLKRLIGNGTRIQFQLTNDSFHLMSAQYSSSRCFPKSLIKGFADALVISPGKSSGKIKRVTRKVSQTYLKQLINKKNKWIFLCEKPTSKLALLFPHASAFIFKEGSLLCHLAILLREAKIPAVILHGISDDLSKENSIELYAEPRKIKIIRKLRQSTFE